MKERPFITEQVRTTDHGAEWARTPTQAEVNIETKLSQGPLGIMLTTTCKVLARSLPQLTGHLNDGWGSDGIAEAADYVLALIIMGISGLLL